MVLPWLHEPLVAGLGMMSDRSCNGVHLQCLQSRLLDVECGALKLCRVWPFLTAVVLPPKKHAIIVDCLVTCQTGVLLRYNIAHALDNMPFTPRWIESALCTACAENKWSLLIVSSK